MKRVGIVAIFVLIMSGLAASSIFVFLEGCGSVVTPPLPPWIGTKQLGVASRSTVANGMATDSSGNAFVGGNTTGGLDGNTVTGNKDFFVTKYNSSGVKQWTKQLGVASTDTVALGIATDPSGNSFVAGYTGGALDGNTQTGFQDLFVTKYNGSGVKQWTRQLGAAIANTTGYGVATDPSGNVFVGGQETGGLDGNTLTGVDDFFVTKYNGFGVKQWTRQLGVASKSTVGYAVATDSSGNVFITGTTTGGLDGNTVTGTIDFFVTKYNSSGVKQWTRQLGVSSSITYAYGVATDPSGNIFVTGNTNGGLDGNSLTGSSDFFITKYNSSGVKQWTKQLGAASQDAIGLGIESDALGNVFATGQTTGGLDGNTETGINDFFVTKYDSSGLKLWTRQLGVASVNTYGTAVATDSLSSAFVGGYTEGGLDGNTLTGVSDFFITKYNGSGVKQ